MLQACSYAFSLFLVLTSYYQLKPLSRSLYVTYIGSDKLPLVWLASTIVLCCLLPFFQWRSKKFSGMTLVLASSISLLLFLFGFHELLKEPSTAKVVAFYILIDIYSVVLIELFWALANSSFQTSEGKKWYGLVSGGAQVGAAVGGSFAALLLNQWKLASLDLLLVGASILVLLIIWSVVANRYGLLFSGTQAIPNFLNDSGKNSFAQAEEKPFIAYRTYIIFLAGIVFCSQLIEPIIEYMFMNNVETSFSSLDERTQYLSHFYSMLNILALSLSLLGAPLIQKYFGVIGGLIIQPLGIISTGLYAFLNPSIASTALLKLVDRSCSYSINRASKELLYVPLPARLIHQFKVWIDVFGYRTFRTLGSIFLLIFTQYLSSYLDLKDLILLVITISLGWFVVIIKVRSLYKKIRRVNEA